MGPLVGNHDRSLAQDDFCRRSWPSSPDCVDLFVGAVSSTGRLEVVAVVLGKNI